MRPSTLDTNPFSFVHFGLNFLMESIGSESFPARFHEWQVRSRVYTDLMQTIGSHNSGRGRGISYQDFVRGGHVLMGFDFTADMAEGAHHNPVKYGLLRLKGHFERALAVVVNIIFYA